MAAKTSSVSSSPLTALSTGGSASRGGSSAGPQGAAPAEGAPRFATALAHAGHDESGGNSRDTAANHGSRSAATEKATPSAKTPAPATARTSVANRDARAVSPTSAPAIAPADASASTEESAYAGANLLSSINEFRGSSKGGRAPATSTGDASAPTATGAATQTALAAGAAGSSPSPNPAAWVAMGAPVATNISPSNPLAARSGSGSARANATASRNGTAAAGAAAAAVQPLPLAPSATPGVSNSEADTTDSGDQDAALASTRAISGAAAITSRGGAPMAPLGDASQDQSAVSVPTPAPAVTVSAFSESMTPGAGKDASATLTRTAAAAVTDPASLPDLMRTLAPAAASNAVAERTVAVPVSDPHWPSAVAGQVQWMVGGGVQSATLRLSPEHLGPVEVRIDVQQSQINVSFTASHAETRSALEQAMPRLRELFASSGLSLGQASVQQETRSNSQFAAAAPRSTPAATAPSDSMAASTVQRLGLVDEYA